MNRTVHTYQIKTLSQYPFLIGEILRRAEQRRVRRAKRGTLFRKLNGLNTLTTFKDVYQRRTILTVVPRLHRSKRRPRNTAKPKKNPIKPCN